eukprot:GGOE01003471.1.p1 GENE.GGOE01003471.1~~GGOE01003471.1.p1  ORF type:complete len:212 (-),score=21.22 GGOE01003471.1:338-946(-)
MASPPTAMAPSAGAFSPTLLPPPAPAAPYLPAPYSLPAPTGSGYSFPPAAFAPTFAPTTTTSAISTWPTPYSFPAPIASSYSFPPAAPPAAVTYPTPALPPFTPSISYSYPAAPASFPAAYPVAASPRVAYRTPYSVARPVVPRPVTESFGKSGPHENYYFSEVVNQLYKDSVGSIYIGNTRSFFDDALDSFERRTQWMNKL